MTLKVRERERRLRDAGYGSVATEGTLRGKPLTLCHSPMATCVEHDKGIEFSPPPTTRTWIIELHAGALELPLLVKSTVLFFNLYKLG